MKKMQELLWGPNHIHSRKQLAGSRAEQEQRTTRHKNAKSSPGADLSGLLIRGFCALGWRGAGD